MFYLILEDEKNNNTNSTAEEKARLYYLSCLDKNETIEKLAATPIVDFLTRMGGWNMSGDAAKMHPDNWQFEEILTRLHNGYNRGGFFSWGVGADDRNSTCNVIQLDQGGLGLPTRDYYLNKSANADVSFSFVL